MSDQPTRPTIKQHPHYTDRLRHGRNHPLAETNYYSFPGGLAAVNYESVRTWFQATDLDLANVVIEHWPAREFDPEWPDRPPNPATLLVTIPLLDNISDELPDSAAGQMGSGYPLDGAVEQGRAKHFGVQYECAGCFTDMPPWPSGWRFDEVRFRAYCPHCRENRMTVTWKDED